MAVIVVVERNPGAVGRIRVALTRAGHRPFVGHSLDQGYRLIRYLRPDLAVLGLYGCDPTSGIALTEVLRATPALARLPIVVCAPAGSLLPEDEDLLRAQQCTILQGPFGLFDLPGLVSTLLTTPSARAVGE